MQPMSKLIRFFILLPLLSALLCADVIRQHAVISTSGQSTTIRNEPGAVTVSFEELIAGAPSTVSIAIAGCESGGTCTTLETNTSTTAGQIRTPTISTVYDYFKITASWTGGSSVSVTINAVLTTAVNGSGGGGGSMTWPAGPGIPDYGGSSAWLTSFTAFGSEAGVATSADPGATVNVPMVADGTHGIKPSPSGALGTLAFGAWPGSGVPNSTGSGWGSSYTVGTANGNLFTNEFTTLGDMDSGGASGGRTRLAGPTGPNGVPQILTDIPSGGAAAAEQWSLGGVPVDATNPATLLVTDRANYLNWTSGTALALPSIGSAGFASNFPFVIQNGLAVGSGNTLVITPNAGNSDLIDGAATGNLLAQFAGFIYQPTWTSGAGAWQSIKFPTLGAFPACADSAGNHLNFSTTAGFSCGTSSGSGTFSGLTPGTNVSTTPFSVAPGSAVGGSTSNFSVLGPASDTNTASVVNVDTGASSTQPSFRAGIQGNDIIKAIAPTSSSQQLIFGACYTSSSPATGSDGARQVACSNSNGVGIARFQSGSASGYNNTVVQSQAQSAGSSAWKLFGGRQGINADGSIGSGTEPFTVYGNGAIVSTPVARTSGVAPYFTINAPADTGQTAATESIGLNVIGATRTWAAGTVATQREYLFQHPTYATGTFTKAATVAIDAAPAGGTFTNGPYALWVQAGLAQFDGGIVSTTGNFTTSITCTAATCLGSATATTQAAAYNTTQVATTAYVDTVHNANITSSGSITVVAPYTTVICTSTCNVTPLVPSTTIPIELCVLNEPGVSTVITMNAVASTSYPKADNSGFGTANTGTMVSNGANGNKVCLIGQDATHYALGAVNASANWTVN